MMNDETYLNAYQVGAFLCGLDEPKDDVLEEEVCNRYDLMNFDCFERIVNDLLPLCTVSHSEFTNDIFCGFADKKNRFFLAKTLI